MAKRILVPVDHDTDYEAILRVAADLARSAGATVNLLHVDPVPGNVLDTAGRVIVYADQEMSRMEHAWLDSLHATGALLEGVAVERTIRFGRPVDEILAEAAAFGADLIVVTTSCRSSLARGLLGSVAELLMKRAPCAVLLLRPAL